MEILNNFPKSTSIIKWEGYLDRKLDNIEKNLLEELKKEVIINRMLRNLYIRLKERNNQNNVDKLYIPLLTEARGNCLFESLVYHGIGNDINSLRYGIGYLMYQFQNSNLPGDDITIKDKFKTFYCDDIEMVYCHTNKKAYDYTYNIMCQDITDDRSWTKLPTNLILLVISWLFNVKIIIITELYEHETVINAYENIKNNEKMPDLRKIYLSHIGGESHYVPLDKLDKNEKVTLLIHKDVKPLFYEWAIEMVKYKYNINSDENDN